MPYPFSYGPTIIKSIGGGAVNFGNAYNISPNSSDKTNAGAGGLNTGCFITTNTGISITTTFDPDGSDQETINEN